MAKRLRFDRGVGLKDFRSVVPMQAIAEINAALDSLPGNVSQRPHPDTVAKMLRRGDAFRQLEEAVCADTRAMVAGVVQGTLRQEPVHVIRCADPVRRRDSHCRHYDSHLLTMLIPLRLAPDCACNGDLIMYRCPRLTVSTLGNVMCKIAHGIHRKLPFVWRKWLTLRDLRRGHCSRVPVQLGSVYVFNGFALKHANIDVEMGQRRSLLIHYYDPGHSLGLSWLMRRVRGV